VEGHAPDVESLGWRRALSGTRRERDDAVLRLHTLLMRAARFQVDRRRRIGTDGGADELDDLALQAADDALVGVLRKLHTYRGDSRFTCWDYKFAPFEAVVRLRRRPCHGRELPLDAEGWARLPDDRRASPSGQAEASELIDAVRDAIAEVLTPHQRAVLVAITLNDVPIDMLAEPRARRAASYTRPCTTPDERYARGWRKTACTPTHWFDRSSRRHSVVSKLSTGGR